MAERQFEQKGIKTSSLEKQPSETDLEQLVADAIQQRNVDPVVIPETLHSEFVRKLIEQHAHI